MIEIIAHSTNKPIAYEHFFFGGGELIKDYTLQEVRNNLAQYV